MDTFNGKRDIKILIYIHIHFKMGTFNGKRVGLDIKILIYIHNRH